VCVIVDGYSRFTWTLFFASKDETFEKFVAFLKKVKKRVGHSSVCLKSNHGIEFENSRFIGFCSEHGVEHNFSAPRTPQQNEVVERKNRTLEDMTRTMLIGSGLARNFWAEALNTACYIINRCMIRPILNKTSYELFKGRKANIMHLRIFGCKCFVHNNGKDALGKFDHKSDEAIFLGYSSHSKAYKVFNKRTLCVEESVYVLFDKDNSLIEKMMHRMRNLSWALPRKISCPLMKKTRNPRRDKALDLFPKQRCKILNKQGELQQNPVWNIIIV